MLSTYSSSILTPMEMVGAEGIEPSTSSASRKHSPTELRAFFELYYLK